MALIHAGLDVEGEVLGQTGNGLVGEDGEKLVAHRLGVEGDAFLLQPLSQLVRHGCGVGCHLVEQAVGEQSLELDSQKPSLGQHSASLLDHVAEILVQDRIQDHHRLAEQGAVFGAADIEDVGEGRDVRHGQVVGAAGEGGSQAGAVQEQKQAVSAADMGERLQLSLGVLSADLRGVGDIYHLRLYHVLVGMGVQNLLHHGRSHFAVRGRKGEHFVAGGFHRSGLVNIDMSGRGADHGLVGAECRCNHCKVDLSAAHQKVDGSVLTADFLPDQIPGPAAVLLIHAVSGVLDEIGFHEGL